jgi:hypothetical protein
MTFKKKKNLNSNFLFIYFFVLGNKTEIGAQIYQLQTEQNRNFMTSTKKLKSKKKKGKIYHNSRKT